MSLLDLFSNNDAEQAASDQTQGLTQGYTDASANIGQGSGYLQNYYTAGLQPFITNFSTGQQGTTQLGNALGLNGPSGSAQAFAAFKNNPGYKFTLNQGTQDVLRNQAASGQLASGATDTALAKYAGGLASTTYNQYLQNLMPYLNLSTSAASGIGSLNAGLGGALNTNENTLGNLAWLKDTGIGNANANAALANYSADANALGALTGIGGSLVKGLGAFMPGSGGSG